MSAFPDTANFYSSLHTTLTREQVANLFRPLGFAVRKCSWVDYEIVSDWAELVIESEGPILMRGPVADVLANAQRILMRLHEVGIAYTAECYDENGELLQEFRWSNSPS